MVGGKPGEEEYTSKFPMMSIESIVGGQGSCSTSTNSGRSSFKGNYLITKYYEQCILLFLAEKVA